MPVLEGWQIAAKHFLRREIVTLQSALVLDIGAAYQIVKEVGKMHHHCLLQVEFLQLPQEVYPLLGFPSVGADATP